MIAKFKEIYEYREMLKTLVKKDLRVRYQGSFLGFLWNFINPLMQLVIYAVIFPYLLRMNQENYAMFLFVALVPWTFFNSTLASSARAVMNNSSLVTKVYFPREILPLSVCFGGLFNMIFSFIIVFPMLIIFDVSLTWNVLWLPILVVIETVMCIGFSLIFSALNVYYRDLEHILNIVLMAWYFFTPVMYSLSMLPKILQQVIYFNPMNGLILAYRNILFYGVGAGLLNLLYPVLFSIAIFWAGMFIFEKKQKGFAEEM